MTWYRISKSIVLNADKMEAIANDSREAVSALGADSIEVATGEDGTATVIARYPDKASMEAAAETAKGVFMRMFDEGAVDPSSLEQWTGEVTFTF